MSLSATFRDCKSVVNAKTEEHTTLIKIPVRFATEWSFKYKSWNKFTTNAFIHSYEDLLLAYKNLAFNKVDQRLMKYLNTMRIQNNTPFIKCSHSQLAKEIGTTREVISKTLKQLEHSGVVKLSFNKSNCFKLFFSQL